jgi:hypothetical protein
MLPMKERMKHHMWCNYFLMRPAKGCPMCEDLRKHYPESLPPNEMMEKYFPDAELVNPEVGEGHNEI